MTNEEATKWLENLKSDIGKMQFRALWGYEQAMDEIIDLLSADKYVPNKACFDCMERGTGMCNGTIQEQSWCPHVADIPNDSVQGGWIPFTRRPMTEEEQKDYPNCTFIFDCVLPDDGDEILVSNGRFVWMDEFCNDIDGCYLDSGDDIDEDMAWMPLPKPYGERREP